MGMSSSIGNGPIPADKRGSLGPRDARTSFTGSGKTLAAGAVLSGLDALSTQQITQSFD